MATFVAELRSLAEHCNYGQTLEVMLCDRIVCGVSDDAIQRQLLSEKDLTFKKALETLEVATRHMKELHTSSKPEAASIEVNKVISGQVP